MNTKSLMQYFLITIAVCFPFLPAHGQNEYTIDENWATIPGGEWAGSTSWVAANGKGQILVMVRTAPYFRLFNRDGTFIRAWGEEGMYNNAHSVSFDPDGNIWSTGAARHVVHKYSPEGELLMTLGTMDEAGDNQSHSLFNQPNHVAAADNGDIYVSDGYQNSRIIQFNSDGDFIRIIGGIQGSDVGLMDLPHGVAVDSAGRILVNDSANQRISVFDSNGNYIESWAFPSRGGIIVAEDDIVYVSDVNAGAVHVLKDGQLLDTISVDARPHGLAVDSDGTVYVSDARGQKVLRISR